MPVRGFSLIELLITLIIVSILAVIVVPNMSDLIIQERLRGALIHLKQELAFARSEAVKRNKPLFISSLAGDHWCVGISLAPNCDCTLDDPETASACTLPIKGGNILRRLSSTDYSDVRMTALKSPIIFDSVRGTTKNNGTFTLQVEHFSGNVVLSALGRVRACGNIHSLADC